MSTIDDAVEAWTERLHTEYFSTEEHPEPCKWCGDPYLPSLEEVSESRWDGTWYCCEGCRDEYDKSIEHDYEE